MLELNKENYLSRTASIEYMSVSQFKAFQKCEFAALEEIQGNFTRPDSTALLVGSYVDAWFEGTLDLFCANHPEILKRDGTLKADYVQADAIIERTKRDSMFSKYMSGEKQVIMTGEIEGVPVKVKIDSYHEAKAIVDLKVMRSFEKLYVPGEGRLNFIEAWRYDLQGAVYQEIVYQNTGKRLPFYIAAITKESTPDIGIFEVPQSVLDIQLDLFRADVNRYELIKEGEIEPIKCGHCDCCKEKKIIKRVTTWEELNEYEL